MAHGVCGVHACSAVCVCAELRCGVISFFWLFPASGAPRDVSDGHVGPV